MKRIHLTAKDAAFVAATAALVIGVATIGWALIGMPAIGIALGLAVVSVLFSSLEVFRRTQETNRWLREQVKRDYKQIESLLSLYFSLKPDAPLPDTGGWALSPDLLQRILEVIHREKPRLVLETGSGVSTLITAYCLKRFGGGRVISLEHDAEYAATNRDMVARHGLQDLVTIVHAPLKEIAIGDDKWLWYDLDGLSLEAPIDLLLIDGPPAAIQPLARYPALPLLFDRLRDGATIILDDGARPDERQIAERWAGEFDVDCHYVPLEKGAFVFRKRASREAHNSVTPGTPFKR